MFSQASVSHSVHGENLWYEVLSEGISGTRYLGMGIGRGCGFVRGWLLTPPKTWDLSGSD